MGGGREGKEGGERSRRRRFSIDGRLNNSKASCPAIFKRRAPTCACGRNPCSNSASPNKCILLMERVDAFTSRIVYPALALARHAGNREFLGRISIFTTIVCAATGRKIEGKRSQLFPMSYACTLRYSTLRYSDGRAIKSSLESNRPVFREKLSRIIFIPGISLGSFRATVKDSLDKL